MAEGFVQHNGSLPYVEGTPNASAFKEPYPYFEFRQTNPKIMTATGSIKVELKNLGKGGTVDLTVRPIISGKIMQEHGWDVPDDELATVYSSTFTNQDFGGHYDEIVVINVTPILADGSILSPEQLSNAAYEILINNNDSYKIQMGDKFYGDVLDDVINNAVKQAIQIHELHYKCMQQLSLPYIVGTPESYAFESPTPYALYKQNDDKYNGLPYLDFSEAYGFTIPTPFALYMQKDGMYDGLPYLNFPPEFLILSPPFPHEMITDNKAKKKQYTIIVSNYSEKITVPDYRFEVIGKYPSTKRGDLI